MTFPQHITALWLDKLGSRYARATGWSSTFSVITYADWRTVRHIYGGGR